MFTIGSWTPRSGVQTCLTRQRAVGRVDHTCPWSEAPLPQGLLALTLALLCDRWPQMALLLHRQPLMTPCFLVSFLAETLISLTGHHFRFVLLPIARRPPVCSPKDSQSYWNSLLSSDSLVQVPLLVLVWGGQNGERLGRWVSR